MPIRFSCPNCQVSVVVGGEHAGKTGKCLKCGEAVTVPLEQDSVAEPLVVSLDFDEPEGTPSAVPPEKSQLFPDSKMGDDDEDYEDDDEYEEGEGEDGGNPYVSRKRRRGLLVLICIGFLVLGGLGFCGYIMWDDARRLEALQAWERAKSYDKLEFYESFLENFGNSSYANEATIRHHDILWRKTVKAGLRPDYTEYLSFYENGEHAETAQERINEFDRQDELKREREEAAIQAAVLARRKQDEERAMTRKLTAALRSADESAKDIYAQFDHSSADLGMAIVRNPPEDDQVQEILDEVIYLTMKQSAPERMQMLNEEAAESQDRIIAAMERHGAVSLVDLRNAYAKSAALHLEVATSAQKVSDIIEERDEKILELGHKAMDKGFKHYAALCFTRVRVSAGSTMPLTAEALVGMARIDSEEIYEQLLDPPQRIAVPKYGR